MLLSVGNKFVCTARALIGRSQFGCCRLCSFVGSILTEREFKFCDARKWLL
jgi:hypothetical protein